MSITALQEIRWTDTRSQKVSKSMEFSSGNSNKQHEFGTGFALQQNIVDTVIKLKPVNEKICYIRLTEGRTNTKKLERKYYYPHTQKGW